MDLLLLLGIAAALVGIIAGVVQVIQYVQEQREKSLVETPQPVPSISEPTPPIELPSILPLAKIESNLPRREPFIGRDREKREVRCALDSPLPIVSITGIGGIGKSALAREVAYGCLEEGSFEAAIWISARDYKPTLESILDSILRAAGLNFALKLPAAEKHLLVEEILKQHRLLLVLDSYEEVADVKEIASFITLFPSPSEVLLTTRQEVSVNAVSVVLRGMTAPEALALIREHAKVIGLEAIITVDEADLQKLAGATGYAPLAIKWALGQIKQKGQSLEIVLNWLDSAKGEIFKSIFDYSWTLLNEPSKLTLMASSVFAAPATYEAYIATTELGSSDLEDAITQLVELSLLDASDELLLVQRRYSVHPLTRSFARAQLRRRQDLEQQLQANSACFFHQYTITHGGEKWDWGSFDALEQEYANITNAVDWYFSQCDWQAIKDLRNALTLFLSIRGHWSKRVELAERTLRACQETGDKRLYAWCLVYDLAYIDLKYNSLDRAETRVKEGLKIFEDYKDELGVANATRHLGRIEHVRGNYELAETLYRKSHTLYVCQDTEYGAFLLWDLGDLHFTLKNYELAETYFQQTLEQSAGRKGKSEAVQAMASGYLGELAEMHGDIDKAQLYYSQELAIAQSIGRADEIALANKRMARLMAMARKDYASALRFAQAAYLVYYQLADYKTCADLKQMIQWLESPVDTRSDPPDAALLLDQREAS